MGSIFASRTQVTIPIPFDSPNEVTIQKLTGRQLGKAQQAFFNELIAGVQERGGAKVQKDIQTLFEKDKTSVDVEVAKVQADPLNGYDPYVLILYGVKAWTYPESLKPVMVVDEESERLVEAVKAVAAFLDNKGLIADAIDKVMSVAKVMRWRIPAVEALDAEAVDFFAREVLKLTKPSLFLNTEEAKATQREADGVSPIA